MRWTISTIGMSTPCRCASARALAVVTTPFGDGLLAREHARERRAPPDLDADRAIAAEPAGARQHEVAQAGEPGERRRARAEATPSRVISASPRVMSAAREL